MKTQTIEIVDRGRGPQLSTSRITVLDVFYYLHRGHGFDMVHQAMPSLTREEFDVIVAFTKSHHDELVEKDRRADAFHQERMDAQHAKGGVFAPSEENLTTEERVARLKKKMEQKLAEKNGAHHPD
jgi:hypothetical protein